MGAPCSSEPTHACAHVTALQLCSFKRKSILFSVSKWSKHPCLVLQSILIPMHALSSRTMKSAGSRYVLWALCHLALPACSNWWWNKGIEAIAIRADNVAPLAPGLTSLGKAERTGWFCFLAKREKTGLTRCCCVWRTLTHMVQEEQIEAKERLPWGSEARRTLAPPSETPAWIAPYHTGPFTLGTEMFFIFLDLKDKESISTHKPVYVAEHTNCGQCFEATEVVWELDAMTMDLNQINLWRNKQNLTQQLRRLLHSLR